MSCIRCVTAVLIFATLPLSVLGQDVSATITGSIKDPSGAVVPGARVTVTNLDTNISKSTTTGSSGDYLVPLLRPGRYSLTVSLV